MRTLLLAFALYLFASMAGVADISDKVGALVAREIQTILPADGIGGAAVAVRIGGRTLFFNYGVADTTSRRPITADSLFNIASGRKLFEATLIAQAVQRGELRFDDRAARYVTELGQGGAISRVTIGQLATYTSTLLLPQDHEPWPDWGYTLPEFLARLNAWVPERGLNPGEEHIYSHAGYVLLQLVLERRFGMPIGELVAQRLLQPLGLASTVLPPSRADGRAELSPELTGRAVQGYDKAGVAIGAPGDQQGYYHFPGTSQMFSTARDLSAFLAAQLGEMPKHGDLHQAMELTQRPVARYGPTSWQALAWEVNYQFDPPIVEKVAGLNNTSGYLGMIPAKKIGIVILSNRGSLYAAAMGRRILPELARR